VLNWAIELESPIDLHHSGWNKDSLKPGDSITVEGMAARNGSRQAWGKSVVLGNTGRRILTVSTAPPPPPLSPRPTPRWALTWDRTSCGWPTAVPISCSGR